MTLNQEIIILTSLEEELKEYQNSINEHFNLGKNLEESFNELWKIIETLTATENLRQKVGKKGKFIPSAVQQHQGKHPNEYQCNQLDLLILGDDITKYIIPENVTKRGTTKTLNYSHSKGQVRAICDQLKQLQEEHANTKFLNIFHHVVNNLLPRDDPEDTSRKIRKLLLHIQQEIPEALILFSGFLPKNCRSYYI